MTTKPRIAIVIGSTRPGRYADKAAGWMLKQTQARDDIEAELLDLRDHPLPFFDEKGPLISTPSENAEALRWQKTLAPYDGFVFVVAEYNQSITGVLKNALDQAYKEWGRNRSRQSATGGPERRGQLSTFASSRSRWAWYRPRRP
jgi:NAD(P)H-dependent FMN reductase